METNELYQGVPSTAEETIFTVGTNNTYTKVHKLEIVITNNTTADATIALSKVKSGNTAGNANRIIAEGTVIPANSTNVLTFNQSMETGDFLSAIQGTANSITLTISGVTE